MTVNDLSVFIREKQYLQKSKPRPIMHLTSPMENLINAMTEIKMKLRAFTMLLFRVVGLGHLEEALVIKIV